MTRTALFVQAHFLKTFFICRMAEEFGMQLVHKTRFDDLFKENSERGEYRMLLNKMQALEVKLTCVCVHMHLQKLDYEIAIGLSAF